MGYLIMVFPIIAIISLFLIYFKVFYDAHNKCRQSAIRYMIIYVFIGYCLSLVYLTILWYFPNITIHPGYRLYNLRPFIWISETYEMGVRKMIEQLVLNIGMFIPYGLLLPIIFKKLRKISGVSAAVLLTTCAIEIVQFIIGRSADIDDVIMNFFGGAAGYLLYRILHHILQKKLWWKKITNSNDE